MRIDKVIKGEKTPFYIKLIPNTMTAEVRFFMDDSPVIGNITQDLKHIVLPDDFLSQYITGHGRVKVGKLKIDKKFKLDVIDYNENLLKKH